MVEGDDLADRAGEAVLADGASADGVDAPVLEVSAAEPEADRRGYEEIAAAIRQLSRMFDARFSYDQTKERVIDQLHAEVLQHRAGLRYDLLRPIFTDLVALHDDLAALAEAVVGDESTPDHLRQSLPSYVTTIEEILERNGVEPFEDEGPEFNGKRQRAARTVPTADPEQHGRIAARSRKGFAYGDRVVRPEFVAVFRYTKPAESTEQVEMVEEGASE